MDKRPTGIRLQTLFILFANSVKTSTAQILGLR